MQEPDDFLQFVRKSRLPIIPDEFGFAQRVKFVDGSNEALFLNSNGQVVDRFDFSPFFPQDNGELPPYHRRRVHVDRVEAGMYFRYRRACAKNDWEDQGFEPFPLPTREQIEEANDDSWPFP